MASPPSDEQSRQNARFPVQVYLLPDRRPSNDRSGKARHQESENSIALPLRALPDHRDASSVQLRHPNVLIFKDSLEVEEKSSTTLYLVTEPIQLLSTVLRDGDLSGHQKQETAVLLCVSRTHLSCMCLLEMRIFQWGCGR